MPISQEGYDSIDNTNGLLIKTAGYPGGITSAKTIGTVTFKALNDGQAAIQLTSDTFALNAQNANLAGNLDSSQIIIETPETAPEEETPQGEETPSEEETTPSEEVTTPAEEEETVPAEEEQAEEEIAEATSTIPATGFLADIGALPISLKVLFGLVIIAAIVLIALKITKKKNSVKIN